MSKESFVFLLGCITVCTPFLGIPGVYKERIIIVCGVLLILVGYRLRRLAFLRSIQYEGGERRGDTFVESNTVGVTKLPEHKDTTLSV